MAGVCECCGCLWVSASVLIGRGACERVRDCVEGLSVGYSNLGGCELVLEVSLLMRRNAQEICRGSLANSFLLRHARRAAPAVTNTNCKSSHGTDR